MINIKKYDNIWFTSDTHISHKNIILGVSDWKDKNTCRKFSSLEEMEDLLVNNFNEKIKENDLLFHLGDLHFGSPNNGFRFLSKLTCKNVVLIRGNHDAKHNCHNNPFVEDANCYFSEMFLEDCLYKEMFYNKTRICMMHYPINSWNGMQNGAIHLFGHCVDSKTEILTDNGWKKYNEISKTDLVYSIINKNIVKNKILNIIINNSNEDMFLHESKSTSFCVTKKHRMLKSNGNYELAENYFNKWNNSAILSGYNHACGIDLSDDLLRLYICIAADGSYNEKTNLSRLRVLKDRKIQYFKKILHNLNLEFSENIQKDKTTCISFQTPKEIKKFNIKGLDWKLINCTRSQVEVIEEAYRQTDGTDYNTYSAIYTSKKQEADIINAIFSLNGYSVNNNHRREHGFSNKDSFQLNVVKDRLSVNKIGIKNNPPQYIVPKDKINWCITTEIGNFLCRRNGKTYFTGNCHSSPKDKFFNGGKSMDVGLDGNNYNPYSIDEIFSIMENRQTKSEGHH